MKFTPTKFPDVVMIEPEVFGDSRGFFYESYQEDAFRKNGIRPHFVQDNHSRSSKGVLRALHFQTKPREQAKLIRVIRGEVFDVVVDVRPDSKTFGQHFTTLLNSENKKMLFIPSGFAHGFLAMEDGTEFLYKVTDFYSPEHERGILWSDTQINIAWPKLDIEYILSDKDKKNKTLKELFG